MKPTFGRITNRATIRTVIAMARKSTSSRNPRKRRIVVAALAAAAVVGGVLFIPRGSGPVTTTGKVVTIAATDVRSTTSAVGTVQPARQVALTFPVSGRITGVTVNAGSRVKAGDVIASVDDTDAKLEVETKAVAVEEATARYETARRGLTSTDRAANAAGAGQARSQVSEAAKAAGVAERAAGATIRLQKTAVKLAEDQAARDEQLVAVEVKRLTDFRSRLLSAQIKRDEAKVAVEEAKLRTASSTQKRDTARTAVDVARQEAARLGLVRDDAQRALDKATADYEKQRSLTPGGTNADGMIVVPVLPPDNVVVNARNAFNAAARAATTADTEIGKAQTALEAAIDGVSQAERDQATAQSKTETAEANITTATANIDTAEPRVDAANEQARKSVDAAKSARATLVATRSKENQTLATAKSQTRAARENVKVVAAQNRQKAQGPKASDVAAAKASVKAAEVQLKIATEQLSKYQLKAPFDGVVSQVGVKVGEQIGTTAAPAGTSAANATVAPAFTLLEQTGLYVRVGFPEVDATRITQGASTTVTFEAIPDQKVGGRIISIEPTATVVNGVSTYFARVELDQQPIAVRVGMNANVEVLLGVRKGALTVPANALHQVKGRTYVTVLEAVKDSEKPNPVERVVEIGVRSEGQVEITSGLAVGDQIELPIEEGTK
jgi:HlyD family secretion protein